MNKEVKELLNKCDNCKLKECIGCEFTYVDIQKIKKYVGNIEILNETYQVINELSEREIGVRIDIWTHLMRGCIMELCTLI